MAENIQIPVSLGLQQALSQAAALKNILNESVKPDSSAYREINNMLNRITRQAEMFRQTMGESLKTSSGTKTFTNNLQKTFDLLGVVTTKLMEINGKDLIFSESDTQRIQEINQEIVDINENIKTLRSGKINGFFDDGTIVEFKQIQDLAAKLGVDLKTITFAGLQKSINKELTAVNNEIDESKGKIKELDNVLNNSNLNDTDKLKSNLINEGFGTFAERINKNDIKAANAALQEFKKSYAGLNQINEKISSKDSVEGFLNDERDRINRVLDEEYQKILEKKNKIQQALREFDKFIGTGSGQSREDQEAIINQQADLLGQLGFKQVFDSNQDPMVYAGQVQQFLSKILSETKIEEADFEPIRSNLMNGLENVFSNLRTEQVVQNAKLYKEDLVSFFEKQGVDKDAISNLFKGITNDSNVNEVMKTITERVQQYLVTTRQLRDETEQNKQEQETYAASLTQSSETVAKGEQTQQQAIEQLRGEILILRAAIVELTAERERSQATRVKEDESVKKSTETYHNLTNSLNQYSAALIKSEQQTRTLGNIRSAIANWMGFNQVLNLTRRAASDAINHIKQLDTTMNGIAIVTDMTTADLWKQVDAYSEIAQNFGVTIQGAYEVSKIYYQAGYDTNEVLTLTNETLKLAKISGLDYATTTDYMMTAMRGFKLEMEDASRVVDVYSNLAANTAVSQQELAEAMTRTASSMESVGATFEETSAMIATMVAVTRESANNIGSAMKSIASRYGELTKDPAALFDAEGEAMSFNKVDEALRSVGITLQTTDHQFRDFTDVILELADKWDTLDSAQQRYIATQFAGNRQQSRFLALVSNVDLLRENLENAQNSEDVGTLQTLKALDSLESKLNQVQVAYQQFYTTIGIEDIWKGLLDSTTNVINTLNGLPKIFDKVPVNAAAMVYTVITLIKNVAINGFSQLATELKDKINQTGKEITVESTKNGEEAGKAYAEGFKGKLQQTLDNNNKKIANVASTIGSIAVTVGALVDKSSQVGRNFSAWTTSLGGVAQTAGGIVQAIYSPNKLGAIMNIATGVLNVINGISIGYESTAEKLERLTEEAENLNNEAKKAKAEYNTLNRSIDKIDELDAKRNESIEATEDYHEAVNELADSFPQLIIGMDEAGNAIINTADAENILTDARQKAADAAIKAAKKEYERAQEATTQIAQNAKETLAPFAQPGQTSESYAYQGKIYKVDLESDLNELKKKTDLIGEWGIDIARAFNDWDGLINELESAKEVSEDEIEQFKTAFSEWLPTLPSIDIEEGNIPQGIQAAVSLSPEQLLDPEVQKQIFDLNKVINESNFKFNTEEEAEAWSNFISELKTLINTATVEANAQRRLVSQSLSQQNNELANSGLLNQLTTSLLIATKENPLDVKEQVTATQLLLTWWEGLGETQKVAENIFKNLSDYSLNDIYQLLDISEDKNYLTDFARDEAIQMRAAISNYYYTQVQDYSESIQLQLEKSGLNIKSDIFESKLGLSVINNAANLIIDYEKRGLADNAEQLRAIAYNLFSELSLLSKEAPEQFVAVLKLLDQGFSTKEDIKNLQSRISELGLGDYGIWLINILDSLSSTIVTNYVSSLNTALNTNTDKYKNDIKTISKLSKGLSIDELYDFLASSLNILQYEADKFTQDMSGAFKLSDTLMKEYWDAYIKENYEISDEIKSFTENIRIGRRGFVKTGNVTENLAHLNLDPNATDEEIEQAIDNYLKLYDATQQQVDFLKKQITAELNASLGDYSEQIQQYKSIFVFANAKLDKNDIIGRETQKTLNDAYSSLISDVLSKGFENINLNDYTGLFNQGAGIQIDLDKNGSYLDFVNKYIDYTGKTISEINSLIVEAIQKDSEKTIDAAEAMKDVTFISEDLAYASLDTAQKLADIFNMSIKDLIDKDDYNAVLGGYKVKDLSIFEDIENSKEMVADSIQSFFESIANLIDRGLSGKLDRAGADSLVSNLNQYGIKLTEVDFFQTAEGLQLSATAAIRIYSELKNIDSIRARLVFDSLKDSLTESGEACENLSSTLAEIARLEKELASLERGSNKPLEDRLALYKEIARSQALDPNEFKFMDRNLPSGMQSPENYWNAAGKAFTSINNAKTTGYMAIEDYYNLVNEMAHMVEISNGEFEWMGMTTENVTTEAARLIEAGMNSLVNVDGKGVQISMAELGKAVNLGASDMSKGLDAGLKVMANEQIKMLDAQINFLEGIVALQSLSDVAGEDGWDLSDIFDEKEFSTKYVETLAKSADKLSQIEFNGTNLYAFLTDYKGLMAQFGEDKEKVLEFIKALSALANSEDWTTTNIYELFEQFGIDNGIEINIKPQVDEEAVEETKTVFQKIAQQVAPWFNTTVESARNLIANSPFGKFFNKNENKTEEKSVTVDVQYSKKTPKGLEKLIEAIDEAITRSITTENSMNITSVDTEDGIELVNGFYQVKTQSSTLEISASIGEVIGLEETTDENGEKGYKIILANGEGFSIPAAIDGENITGIVPNEDGTSYTINLSNDNGFSIPAKINDQQVVGMDYDAKNGIVTLKTNNNQGFSIPVKIDDQQVTGMRYNETEKKYYIDLANGQSITILTSADDGYSTDILNWANSNTVEIKTKFKNIDELPDPTDSDKLKLKIYSGASLTDDELKYITELAKTSEDWANILANANINLDNNNQATQEATEANNNNTESVENHTSAINESTEQTEKYSKNVSKATTDVQLSSKRFIKAGNDLIPIGNASLRVATAEERLITTTNLLVKAIDASANTINNTIKNMAGYAPMTSGTTLGNRTQMNKPVAAKATGNIALATGRSTLMGELGPELYVTNGHYYVVGQNGAEFVNLPDDAIVFNHLQTARLLANGNTGRGKPVTNERKATSYAKGNIAGGPAKASAAAVLSQLKQIRAMWQSMLDASAKDLGSLAGGSGGGGGGGGKNWQQKTTTAEIQRWYNLIRQIAKLEKDISYEETLQSKIQSDRIANGRAMYKSYKAELEMLRQEIVANQELAALQRSWYDAKRAELAASDYGRIFTYDENGLQQYTGTAEPGSGLGLDILENLTRRDVYGQAIDNAVTAQQQLEYLKSISFNIENLKYNNDGTTIDLTGLKDEELDNAYVQMMENFWTNVDSWRDELDSIYDSYHEQLENVLSNQDKQNEVIQKIVDNQLAVENEVLKAIENREQKRIDDAQDMRNALSDSTDKFINGLTDQLNKEREMYSKNQEQDDLNKLRRQLAILQRSGGSASQIRSLQDQIASKTQDQYFNTQQEQIDSIKQASDAQLERLDHQIDIMTKTLEYEKENGLLWQEVYQVMAGTPAQIQDFIINNTPDFQSNSALQVAEDLRELKLKIEEWVEYRKDVEKGQDVVSGDNGWNNYVAATTNSQLYKGVWSDDIAKRAKAEYEKVYTETSDPNKAAAAANAILQGELNKKNITIKSSAAESKTSVTTTSSGTGNSNGSSKNKTAATSSSGNRTLSSGATGNDVKMLQQALIRAGVGGVSDLQVDGIFGPKTFTALQAYQRKNGLTPDGIFGPATRKKLYGYSEGGLVDYTGLALVHGSSDKPESFLNAEHTKLLKEDMLMRKQLMPSLLSTYNNILQNSTNHGISNSINKNDSLNIEKLELNMSVEHMNNDYDARQAVHTMMDELMNISRKSGNLGIKRG